MLLLYFLCQVGLIGFMTIVGKYDNDLRIFYCCLALTMSYTLYKTVSVGQLVMNPIIPHNEEVIHAARDMLQCIETRNIHGNMTEMKQCVSTATRYNLSKSRIPWMRNVPIAFVLPSVFENHVFMIDEYYGTQSVLNQALILIHECTHLVLSTLDYAYRWQPEFHSLTLNQHLHNADSFVDDIIHHCLNDIDVSF